MKSYTEIVSRLRRPSIDQITAFSNYVAEGHSWYKHLPLWPPGVPFVFYLDPNAGCDLLQTRTGVVYRERAESGFHYSAIPTSEYRERFGHLEYFVDAGTRIQVSSPDGILNTRNPGPAILVPQRGWLNVPAEILERSTVRLTGIVHRITIPSLWVLRLRNAQPEDLRWIRETLGEDFFDVLADCDPFAASVHEAKASLEPMLASERARQRATIVQGIERALDCICRGPG